MKHPAYAAPAEWRDGVFHLSEPDHAPPPAPSRCALEWRDRMWIERDPRSGAVLAVGEVGVREDDFCLARGDSRCESRPPRATSGEVTP